MVPSQRFFFFFFILGWGEVGAGTRDHAHIFIFREQGIIGKHFKGTLKQD